MPQSRLVQVSFCLAALTATHLVYLLNAWFFVDNGSIYYAYETSPGYIALGTQFVTMIYFGNTIITTISGENHNLNRKNFFGRCVCVCVCVCVRVCVCERERVIKIFFPLLPRTPEKALFYSDFIEGI